MSAADVKSAVRIDVAVAVIFNELGQVLWACRPEGKPYPGYWEFPGGKVEPGESVWQATVRELREELDITVLDGGPWFVIEHDYEHAKVRLHLMQVTRIDGQPTPMEGQQWCWADLSGNGLTPILPATEPLLPMLAQPRVMIISGYGALGADLARATLVQHLSGFSPSTPGMARVYCQFREPSLNGAALSEAFEEFRTLAQGHQLLINSATFTKLVAQGALIPSGVGIHLTESDLRKLGHAEANLNFISSDGEPCPILGASVHCERGVQMAFDAGLSYALLGPVLPTATHPGQQALGWSEFSARCAKAKLPVFAIGGLNGRDLHKARHHGAHGVAFIRGLEVTEPNSE